jgi:hypothetical protein
MGSFIVLVVLFAPRGLLGLVDKFSTKTARVDEEATHG